jgi:hypothetical protein
MNIAFFEIRLSSINMYQERLIKELNGLDKSLKIFFYYEQNDFEPNLSNFKDIDLVLIKINKISFINFSQSLKENQISKLVVFAQRIPDSFVVAVAKKNLITSIMIQHGLYVPFMKRKLSLFFYNLYKSFRYLKYSFETSKLLKKNSFIYLIKNILVWIFGFDRDFLKIKLNILNTDYVLVWGEYWKKYHNDEFGYEFEKQFIIGNPDYNNIKKNKLNEMPKNTMCYISQTLVEDGRLSRKIFLNFLKNLKILSQVNNLNLTFKLHPRSDLSLYSGMFSEENLVVKDLPKSHIYIGHYSSLLAKTIFNSHNLILVDFPGHQIPSYIKEFQSFRVDYDKLYELEDFLSEIIPKNLSPKLIDENILRQNYFFDSSIENPLKSAANKILQLN